MAKKENAVETPEVETPAKKERVSRDPSSALTKTQARVMMGICTILDIDSTDKKVIGAIASLETVQEAMKEIDVPKVSRQLHREELLTYTWNEDRTRNIGITAEGFKALQLPPKEKKVPAPKEPKEKKEVSPAAKTEAGVNKAVGSAKKDAAKENTSLTVAVNVLMKKFVLTYDGKAIEVKAKDAAEFAAMKAFKTADWMPYVLTKKK